MTITLRDIPEGWAETMLTTAKRYARDYPERKATPGFRRSLCVYTFDDRALAAYWTKQGVTVRPC